MWPSPGIYDVTSTPFERRTLAIFLKAELGFLGVADRKQARSKYGAKKPKAAK